MKTMIGMRVAAAVALSLSFVGQANAQAGNDVRCLLASNLFSRAAKDPKARTAAEASKLFYLGRIYGRLNSAQLKAELLAQQKTITPKNAGDVMNSCARQMDAAIKTLQGVTQQLRPKK